MSSCLTTDRTSTAFDVLADANRRYLLSTLSERTDPLSLETLATEVAAQKHGSPIVTTEQSRTAHIELVHRHVPKLLEAGVLREVTDGETRMVALANHPIFEAEWVAHLVANPTGGSRCDEPTMDRTLETLRPARRRIVCSVLARQGDALDVDDLAALVAVRENDGRLVDVDESDWRPVATSLGHVHLPALADAGLVAYDRSSGTVEIAADAPQWRADWLAASPLGEVTAALESARRAETASRLGTGATDVVTTGTGACWTIDGRADVIARSHDVADSATEELFVTVPDANILQQRRLERWRAAVGRGVDLYVGSRSSQVREIVRAAVPGATICEPRSDWLNFPAEGVHHGRVVFADRERVLLATVDDANSNDDPRVTAITGEGPENALVMLVREHVGPRLDRLASRRDDGDAPDEPATPLPL